MDTGSMELSNPPRDHAGRDKTRVPKAYSRNGCARCKAQRVRCDEQKPGCGRCGRVGAQCPGYNRRLRWVTKHEVFAPLVSQDRPSSPRRTLASSDTASKQHNARGIPSPSNSTVTSPTESEATSDKVISPTHVERVSDLDSGSSDHQENEVADEGNASKDNTHVVQHQESAISDDFINTMHGHIPSFTNDQGFSSMFSPGPFFDSMSANFSLPDIGVGMGMAQDPLFLGDHLDETALDSRGNAESFPSSAEREGFSLDTESAVQPSSRAARTQLTLRKPLNDPATILIEFYFKETAQLFSCYDSSMNPFRTTVSRLWNSSPLLCRTLQSMAAANLVENFPQLAVLGRRFRNEAIEMLKEDDQGSDSAAINGAKPATTNTTSDTLLAMLMLGGSASWHDPKDLGLTFFNSIRRKLVSIDSKSSAIDYQFFHQCMTYWELLLSYVADDEQLDKLDGDRHVRVQEPVFPDLVPHPWTGFARDTQNAVQKVGRLIRHQRKLAFSRRFTSISHIKQLEKDMATASELEEFLSNMCHPLESSVLDPKDHNTPVWQLLTLAEAYRSVGLIQIYHIFPDLLDRRLAREGIYQPIQSDKDLDDTGTPTFSQETRNEYLTTYAVQVLSLMKTIPLESGTRDFQPFILVSLCSELRLPSLASQAGPDDNYMVGITLQAIETSRMRQFLRGRLESFLRILPPKPIRRCLDIVNRTWELMDDRAAEAAMVGSNRRGSCAEWQEVYWMDVMIENGWETTMA